MNLNKGLFLASCLFTAAAPVTLLAQDASVVTWHNDISRTGLNPSETLLTHTNVNAQAFGKVGFYATDGVVDAQPLHVPGIKINGNTHDVLYVATEHASVYAFDATSGAVLWKSSLLKTGETTSDDHGCGQITPEIGATATPVIDLNEGPHGAIYVTNMTKDASGLYHQRLSALDLVTGFQLFGGPKEVQADYPGYGQNSSNGTVVFNPAQYAGRAALLEWNGAIFTAWTSHCDIQPYTGWVIAYSASTLARTGVLNLTPNGSQGGIWMSGAGLAADSKKIYLIDGNGSFDTTLNNVGSPLHHDFGNSLVALTYTPAGLDVADYYATDNTVQQSNVDQDFGSGGLIVLPTQVDSSGVSHYLAVGAGKDTNIYLVNRDNLGGYHPNGGYIHQALPGALPNGVWGAPAYYHQTVYYGGPGDVLRAFKLQDFKLVSTPTSVSVNSFPYPGTSPTISANGTTNGIVWTLLHAKPAALYAYNADDLSQELYDTTQAGTRDQLGVISHFVSPMIANGRVYVGTSTGVAVFGLLP